MNIGALNPEVETRIDAAKAWLEHARSGRCTLEQAREAIDNLLRTAIELKP